VRAGLEVRQHVIGVEEEYRYFFNARAWRNRVAMFIDEQAAIEAMFRELGYTREEDGTTECDGRNGCAPTAVLSPE